MEEMELFELDSFEEAWGSKASLIIRSNFPYFYITSSYLSRNLSSHSGSIIERNTTKPCTSNACFSASDKVFPVTPKALNTSFILRMVSCLS
jgi:hypothetical protein